jgi:transcription elongation GreA/GreB family factor
LRHLDGRIRFLQKLFHRVQIARPSSTDTAHIGNTVMLTQDTHTYCYRLVDSIQSDLSTGDLSIHSPLGRALVGKKAGDVITYHTPRGEKCTTIVTIY